MEPYPWNSLRGICLLIFSTTMCGALGYALWQESPHFELIFGSFMTVAILVYRAFFERDTKAEKEAQPPDKGKSIESGSD